MIRHPNYYQTHSNGPGLTHLQCCQCPFDSYDDHRMMIHQNINHDPVYVQDNILDVHIHEDLVRAKRVVVGVLTSATDWEAEGVRAASKEVSRMRELGISASLFWVDNGSPYTKLIENQRYTTARVWLDMNLGQSIARNYIIDYAITQEADYLILVDGDIEMIPYSGYALTMAMGKTPMGCLGLHSHNCTEQRDHTSDACVVIDRLQTKPQIAWTQYGIFDCKMFMEGIRFDTSPVFMFQGWGFEDDELYLQMIDKGYESYVCNQYRYGHFARNSSLRAMDRSLAAKVFKSRKSFIFSKWAKSGNPRIQNHLAKISGMWLPTLT